MTAIRTYESFSQYTNSHSSLGYTVDWEIFTLKIIRVKTFRVNKFLQFHSIRKIFLMVNGYNMDKHLESS